MIHPSAEISQGAKIADNVKIGPFCHVGEGVVLKEGVVLEPHVTLKGAITLGKNVHLYPFTEIGNGQIAVQIGESSVIREFTKIGTRSADNGAIEIHSHCYIMAYVTMYSGAQIQEHCIITNNVHLGQNSVCQAKVIVAAKAHIAKGCTIGTGTMVGGVSMVTHDVPPYCLVEGSPHATIRGLNLVGMRRNFEDRESISQVKKAFIQLKKSNFSSLEAKKLLPATKNIYARQFVTFIATHKTCSPATQNR